MSLYSPVIADLIKALQCLPGIGGKSAQRIALHLLSKNRNAGLNLAKKLEFAMLNIGRCQACMVFSELEICHLCQNPKRDGSQLCIVETPSDVIALEYNCNYRGLYFVLGGRLSPLDNVGPKDLGLDQLPQRLETNLYGGPITEIILAINSTIESETTSYYIIEVVKELSRKIKISRLARGVPLGISELEYINQSTLTRALEARETIYSE